MSAILTKNYRPEAITLPSRLRMENDRMVGQEEQEYH